MNYENMHTLKSRLGNYDAGSLLDIAVGRGDFLRFALGSFHTWKSAAGIDLDPESLRIAAMEFSNTSVILILGSALNMPFTGSYFDTVTMSNALHHIEALQPLFTETGRVCKARGLIVINEMLNESHSLLQESYMLYHRLLADVDNQLGHFHREPFTLKELLSIIKTSGFDMIDYFIHEETTGDYLNREEMDAMSERLKKKVLLLRGSDYYYFYENKAREIINRLTGTGVHRPRHITFMLQPN
jgi:ubiquinone/menaquinone biosynthesis C-methylase UbiE